MQPSLNRALTFFRDREDSGNAALIVHVWSDALVNVVWFDHNGGVHAATSVALLAPGTERPERGYFAEWPKRS